MKTKFILLLFAMVAMTMTAFSPHDTETIPKSTVEQVLHFDVVSGESTVMYKYEGLNMLSAVELNNEKIQELIGEEAKGVRFLPYRPQRAGGCQQVDTGGGGNNPCSGGYMYLYCDGQYYCCGIGVGATCYPARCPYCPDET